MRVELGSLEGKGSKFAHGYAPGELVLDDDRIALTQPPGVFGRIIRKGNEVVVEGQLTAVIQVECDRCLRPVTLPIQSEFAVEFVTTEAYKALEVSELGEEDLALSVFDGEFIDVDEIVAEQLMLAVPSQAICRADCKGLCAVCGADRNLNECDCKATEMDPRWSTLKELVNRKS